MYQIKLKRMLLFFVFILLSGLIMIGCSSETTDQHDSLVDSKKADSNEKTDSKSNGEGELRVAYSAQPLTLDPHLTTAVATSDIMRPVYETLLTIDSKYNIKPMLAESWEQSDDGLTFTFKLREGILFHNGEEMKADDVVASMNRWKDSLSDKELFAGATINEKDDYTVELQLSKSLSIASTVIASQGPGKFAAIMPKEIVENAKPEGIDEYIGTGPFQFKEWKQDQHIHLTKFDDYQSRTEESDGLFGKKEALVQDLYYLIVSDSSTRIAGIQSGEYDVAHAIPFDSAEILESDPSINNHTYPGASLYIFFNKKKGLFKEAMAREAVSVAMDMEAILTAGYKSEEYYIFNHNILMQHQNEQWASDIGKDKYNINDKEKAKQMFDDLGYNGEEITIITTRDYDDQYNGAVVMQEQLEQLGINVDLQIYDWPTLLEKIDDEDAYDFYVMGFVPSSEPISLSYFKKDYAGWTNSPELDQILNEMKNQPTLEDAQSLYDDLQEWYWDYLPVLKIGDFKRVSSTRSSVENFQYQDGFIFWNTANNK